MRYTENYGDHDGSREEIEREQDALQGRCRGPSDPLCDGPDCECQDEDGE